MARIENTNGNYFDIKPVAYQFPMGDDSLNWLQIQLQANDGNYAWETTNPAFENYELSALIQWFRQLTANDPTAKKVFHATEPCVEFAAERVNGIVELTVSLGYDFLPPQMNIGKKNYQKRVRITFIDNGQNLLQFASDLEKELEPFPVRKEPYDDE